MSPSGPIADAAEVVREGRDGVREFRAGVAETAPVVADLRAIVADLKGIADAVPRVTRGDLCAAGGFVLLLVLVWRLAGRPKPRGAP